MTVQGAASASRVIGTSPALVVMVALTSPVWVAVAGGASTSVAAVPAEG